MASVKLPQATFSEAPRTKQRDPQTEQILRVLGNNPVANSIETVGTDIVDALARRQKLKRQVQENAALAAAYGLSSGELNGISDPSMVQAAAKFLAEERRPTVVNIVGHDGTSELVEIPAGRKFGGNVRLPSPQGAFGGAASRQSPWTDSSDGMPLFAHPGGRFTRSDNGMAPIGKPVRATGNADVVQSAVRGLGLKDTVDSYRSDVEGQSEIGRRLSLTPIIGPVGFPGITQKINELRQVGFTFGGKAYTGNEAKIIEGAMIPGNLDNKATVMAKLDVIDKYTTGQITLLDAANLLGPAGQQIKNVLNSTSGAQKATHRWNPQTKKVEPVQ